VPFELADPEAPIYSRARFLPPSRLDGATVRQSLVSDGCVIGEGAVVERSVIGLRCRIGPNVVIRDSVILGNDFYEPPADLATRAAHGEPPLGIGADTVIEGAIIDKNVRIGCGARITNEHGWDNTADDPRFVVRDGVVVVPKDAIVPDGWRADLGAVRPG
jgi:glucose-1-phosphate adenylyltransferase